MTTPDVRAFRKEKDPNIVYVSATQISKFLACQRQWAYLKIDRLQEKQRVKKDFGKDAHSILEAWLVHGTQPPDSPSGRVVRAIIKKDWLPTPCLETTACEQEVDDPFPEWPANTRPAGFIDVLDLSDMALPTVADGKTTSSMQYAMSEEELSVDVQAILYAAWLFRELPEAQRVRVRWLYVELNWPQGGGPPKVKSSRRVEHIFERDSMAWVEAWARICNAVGAIEQAKRIVKFASQLPGNGAACGNYGGCDFAEICPITDGDRAAGVMAQHLAIEERKKRLSNSPQCGSSVPPTNGEQQMPALIDRIKARQQTAQVASVAPAPTPAAASPAPAPTVAEAPAPAPAAVAPTPAPAAPAPAAPAPDPRQTSIFDKIAAGGAKKGVNPPAAVAPTAQPTAPSSGPGGTPGGAGEVAVTTMPEAQAPAAAAPEQAAEKPKRQKAAGPKANGANGETLALVIDALYEKNETLGNGVHHLSDFVQPFLKLICGQYKVAHHTQIEFGKWKGDLAACLDKHLAEVSGVAVIMVDSSTPEWGATQDVLRRHAKVVVRGVGR